jgi:hypothetical protein
MSSFDSAKDKEASSYTCTLSKKGRGKKLGGFSRPWTTRTVVINGQVLEYFDGTTKKGELSLKDCTCRPLTLDSEESDGKPFPFEVSLPDKETLIFSASAEFLRTKLLLILEKAAKTANWQEELNKNTDYFFSSKGSFSHPTGLPSSVNKSGGGGSAEEGNTDSFFTELSQLRHSEGNRLCGDCNAINPSWASINNGVFICTKCSGVHRSLGVEYSFVQSVKLDEWSLQFIEQMKGFGSTEQANRTTLEFHVPADYLKPNAFSMRETREVYINAKYKNKLFGPLDPISGQQRERLLPKQEENSVGANRNFILEDEDLNQADSAPSSSGGGGVGGGGDSPSKSSQSSVSKCRPISIGEIEFVGILMVKIKTCQHLEEKSSDANDNKMSKLLSSMSGKSEFNYHVTMSLGNQIMKSKKIISQSHNPEFNETLHFSWDGNAKLNIQVFKNDKNAGSCCVDIASSTNTGNLTDIHMDIPLENAHKGSIQIVLDLNLMI